MESLAGRVGQWWPRVALGNTDRGTAVSREPSPTRLVRVGEDIQLVDEQVGCIRWRQAGSGMVRNRARAERNWVPQGQRLGRCSMRRRALRVIRPAREKSRRRRVLVVATASPRAMRPVQRARLWAMTLYPPAKRRWRRNGRTEDD